MRGITLCLVALLSCFALAYGVGGTFGPLAGGTVLGVFGADAMPMLFAAIFLGPAVLVVRYPLSRAERKQGEIERTT